MRDEGSNPLPSAGVAMGGVCPDGEMEIIPRFYRGVPGSSPGRGAYMRRERKGYPTGDGNRLEAGRAYSLAGSIPAPSAE